MQTGTNLTAENARWGKVNKGKCMQVKFNRGTMHVGKKLPAENAHGEKVKCRKYERMPINPS